ncbi:hypothetical protein MNBD_BACTEROID03-695 [hydrothermal vent metagenome]|uniref:Uncharacterized protein n=1 Tax=hydrothermal vent metagenome TaxID=652676 RepID=A0A3B0TLT3_9ZZZZ
MKIRIKGNSVRFRLTRTEVSTLCTIGRIEEKTGFNDAEFNYAVQVVDNLGELNAEFKANIILLKLPKGLANGWDVNETIGFENKVTLDNGNELALLIEKDFTCLDNTIEDQSDNYPNPKSGH